MSTSKITRFIRFTAALCLCIAMILSVSSCAETGNEENGSATNSADIAQTSTPVIDEPEETDYPYLGVDYGSEEFVIFNCEQKYNMIMNVLADDQTGESVNDAQYSAMLKVESKYNIDLVEYFCAYDNLRTEIQNVCSTNDDAYDVAYLRSTDVGAMFTQSYLHNLYNVPNINMDKPWWNQQLKEDATLLGTHLYYLSSDAHLMAFEGTWGIYFNKDLVVDLNITSPYEEVRNNTWTLARLTELASQCASSRGDVSWEFDSNGSNIYGMASFKNLINALMVGCNEHYCLKNADGEPYYAMATSSTVYDVTEAIAALTSSTKDGAYISANSTGKHYIKDIFSQGRSVFMGGELKAGAAELNQMDSPYGILPIPKYTADQENYVSNILWSTMLMTIPTSCSDVERTAAVMDLLSYYAWRDVLPVYYERLCYRGLHDAESVEMLELIKDTRYLNWALAYDWIDSIEPSLNSQLDAGNAAGISSLVRSSSVLVPRLIKQTIEDLKKIE